MGGRGSGSNMGRFAGTEGVTRSQASDDWFEYEYQDLMHTFIETG